MIVKHSTDETPKPTPVSLRLARVVSIGNGTVDVCPIGSSVVLHDIPVTSAGNIQEGDVINIQMIDNRRFAFATQSASYADTEVTKSVTIQNGDVIIGGTGGGSSTVLPHLISDLSVHTGTIAQSQAPWAVPQSTTISAGSGLTGGGTLAGNLSFAVATATGTGLVISSNVLRLSDAIAGSGLSYSPGVISVKLRTESPTGNISGLQFDGTTGGLFVGAGDGIAVTSQSVRINLYSSGGGNASGMQFDGGALKVGAGNGIAVGSNVVAVNQAYSFVWSAQHLFNSGFNAAASTFTGLLTGTSGTFSGSVSVGTTNGGLNVGTATGAATGEVRASTLSLAGATQGTQGQIRTSAAYANSDFQGLAIANTGNAGLTLQTASISLLGVNESARLVGGNQNSGDGAPGFFAVWTRANSTTIEERLRVNSVGNVGIGIAAPVATASRFVHLSGTTSELHLTSDSSGHVQNDGLSIQMWSDNTAYFVQRENAAMEFWTNNIRRAVIDSAGRLGIGNFSPSYSLDVSGEMRASSSANPRIILESTGSASSSRSFLRFSGTVANEFISIGYYPDASPRRMHINYNSESASLPIMSLTSANRVGINMQTPSYTLDVSGDARVSSGLNVGSATDAATGDVKASGKITANGATGTGVAGIDSWGVATMPSTSGSSAEAALRVSGGSTGLVLDLNTFGTNGVAWIQARSRSDYAQNFILLLNPNGGRVAVNKTSNIAYAFDTQGDIRATGSILGDTSVISPLITTSSGSLTITPVSDLILNPQSGQVILSTNDVIQSSGYQSQTSGMRISQAGEADFRYIYTDELHAKAFIADLEQALAGGQIISKSVAILAADFTIPAGTTPSSFTVNDLPSAQGMRVFETNDVVGFRIFDRGSGGLRIGWAWGTVTNYINNSDGTQTWTFTRLSADSGTASGLVKKDSIVLDFGQSGNGYHEVNAIDGMQGANSPYSQTVTWTTSPKNRNVRSRTGNLRGIFASSTTQYAITITNATSGNFSIWVDESNTGNIAFNASAATVQTLVRNITNSSATVTGTAGSYTVTLPSGYAASQFFVKNVSLNTNAVLDCRFIVQSADQEFGLYAGNGTSASSRYIRASDKTFELVNTPLSLYQNVTGTLTETVKISGGDPSVSGNNPFFAMGNPVPTGVLAGNGIWMGRDSSVYKFRVGSINAGVLSEGILWDGLALTVKGKIEVTGTSTIGTQIGIVPGSSPYIAIGATGYPASPTENGNGIWMGASNNVPLFRAGQFTNGLLSSGIYWDGTTFAISGDLTAQSGYFAGPVTLSANGGIWQGAGAFANPSNGMKIWADTVSEVFQINLSGATSGTFTITVGANTTNPALNWNASAATVQSAVTNLASVETGNATVTLSSGVYLITFIGARIGQDLTVSANLAGIVGGTKTATTIRHGSLAGKIAAFDSSDERVVFGNLKGAYDYSEDNFGLAAGRYATSWIGIDAINGIRVMNSTTERFRVTTGGVVTVGNSSAATEPYISIDSTNGFRVMQSTTEKFRIATSGTLLIGDQNGSDPFISMDSTNGIRIRDGGVTEFQVDLNGNVIVGPATANNVQITASALNIRRGSANMLSLDSTSMTINNSAGNAVITMDGSGNSEFSNVMTIGTNGMIRQGTGTWTSTFTGLGIDSENSRGRIRFFESGAIRTVFGNLNGNYGYTANTYGFAVGSYGANLANVTIEPTNGFRIRNNTSVVFQVTNAGALTSGSTSGQHVAIDSTNGVSIKNGTATRFNINSSGVLSINDSNSNAVITLDNAGNASITGALDIGPSGGIYQGNGTFSNPNNRDGIKIATKPMNHVFTYTVTATGGSFSLTLNGVAVGSVAHNAAATTLQTAINTAIGTGNATVTKASNVFTVTFAGTWAATYVTVGSNGTLLTGGTGSVSTVQAGGYLGYIMGVSEGTGNGSTSTYPKWLFDIDGRLKFFPGTTQEVDLDEAGLKITSQTSSSTHTGIEFLDQYHQDYSTQKFGIYGYGSASGTYLQIKNTTSGSATGNVVIDAQQIALDGEIGNSVSETWVVPTLTTPWANLAGGYTSFSYKRVGDFVFLRGVITRSASTSLTPFTLPANFRPLARQIFVVTGAPLGQTTDSFYRVDILTTGEIRFINIGGTSAYGFLSFGNIVFSVV